jgi:uncharacterized short protein YbdD (DUF466 family)
MTAPARWRRLIAIVKRIAGMPDYHAYVEHLRACHPERAVPTAREYYESFVKQRYDGGGPRCC